MNENNTKSISEILLEESYITLEDFSNANKFAKENHVKTVDYLLSEGIISKELLGQALSEHYQLAFSDLKTFPSNAELVKKLPEETAKKYRVIYYKEDEHNVVFATDSPRQGLKEFLQKYASNKEVFLTYTLSEDLNVALRAYAKNLDDRIKEIVKSGKKIAPSIISEVFKEAIFMNASDIHFEPQDDQTVTVRFRVDGVLQEVTTFDLEHFSNILNSLKVKSKLQIDEHFAAQDGAIRFKDENGEDIDMRVSILPTLDGEKVVIRLLTSYIKGFSLDDLGLTANEAEMLKSAAKKPFGMLIVAGPTGSGKTTTLYSLMKMLLNPNINITTIEDPVEYKVHGINQIQVNHATNLDFAHGLRSIVRQDPDVILVGEIRDEETADIAVNAALTGHLLFSTLHANDAATAVPRLLDMKIDSFLLSSTLELIVSQRLVRKICPACKYSYVVNKDKLDLPKEKIDKFIEDDATFYHGKGCKACNETGYRGRTAIFEFILVSDELGKLIMTNPSANEIWEIAKKEGSVSLFENGLRKVKNGLTSIDELLRVISPPE